MAIHPQSESKVTSFCCDQKTKRQQGGCLSCGSIDCAHAIASATWNWAGQLSKLVKLLMEKLSPAREKFVGRRCVRDFGRWQKSSPLQYDMPKGILGHPTAFGMFQPRWDRFHSAQAECHQNQGLRAADVRCQMQSSSSSVMQRR